MFSLNNYVRVYPKRFNSNTSKESINYTKVKILRKFSENNEVAQLN